MEISRFEKAAIKRTAQNTKAFRVKRDKLQQKAEQIIGEIETLQGQIDAFDAPFLQKYGKSCEQLLAEMNAEENPVEEEVETPEL